MKQKFTILFDLDGTLIDTAPDLLAAHNHVMKKYGFVEKELKDVKKLAGRGAKIMIKKSIHDIAEASGKIKKSDDEIHDLMAKDFIEFYKGNICKKSKLKKGVEKFLSWCKEQKILTIVCTNKQELLAVKLLKEINIYSYFDYVVGGNTFDYNKPDPRHLTTPIEILKGDINKSLMIGDSETDSNAAKRAKIPFVLIKDGYTEKKVNEIYHDYLVDDFDNLEDIVLKYIND